jgi:hypothetical protein
MSLFAAEKTGYPENFFEYKENAKMIDSLYHLLVKLYWN